MLVGIEERHVIIWYRVYAFVNDDAFPVIAEFIKITIYNGPLIIWDLFVPIVVIRDVVIEYRWVSVRVASEDVVGKGNPFLIGVWAHFCVC